MGPSDRNRVIRDRLALLRDRASGIGRPEDLGQGVYLGRVYSGGSLPTAADRYALTRPLRVSGDESEGLAHSGSADATRSVPVLVLGGPPAVGDDLIARLVDGRWVTEKRAGTPGGGGPVTIPYPGCSCTNPPLNIFITVTFAEGESSATYGNQYQPSTIRYYSGAGGDRPGYLPAGAFLGPGYYSITPWIDDYGSNTYYYVTCFNAQWSLGLGQFLDGTYVPPGRVGIWTTSSAPGAQNTCAPFLFTRFQPQINFNGNFLASG